MFSIGFCLDTRSQWIVKVNRIPFIQMNRFLTHCYRVLAWFRQPRNRECPFNKELKLIFLNLAMTTNSILAKGVQKVNCKRTSATRVRYQSILSDLNLIAIRSSFCTTNNFHFKSWKWQHDFSFRHMF